jgi:hypothetical protein
MHILRPVFWNIQKVQRQKIRKDTIHILLLFPFLGVVWVHRVLNSLFGSKGKISYHVSHASIWNLLSVLWTGTETTRNFNASTLYRRKWDLEKIGFHLLLYIRVVSNRIFWIQYYFRGTDFKCMVNNICIQCLTSHRTDSAQWISRYYPTVSNC